MKKLIETKYPIHNPDGNFVQVIQTSDDEYEILLFFKWECVLLKTAQTLEKADEIGDSLADAFVFEYARARIKPMD